MTDQLSFDAPAAIAAGVVGMELADGADRVQLWKDAADAWFESLRTGARWTADDLVAAVGLPDEGVNRNNVVGAWVNGKSRRCERRTYRRSSRVIGHGRVVSVWRKLR